MSPTNFQSLTVLTLESRRGQEITRLIETYGGKPLHAAAMREILLSSNTEALHFADALFQNKFDAVIFLTGVGARALATVVQSAHPQEKFIDALRKISVIARGPKPVAVLREWNVPVALTAPEPNTWRELLHAIDTAHMDLRNKQIAVQEYGVSNPELLAGLRERGAIVTPVPVYQWDLPEDLAPLHSAIHAIIDHQVDVALFTTGVQVSHLFQVAEELHLRDALQSAFASVVKASIGPTTSESLQAQGLSIDLEASHPKMGFLVKEAAEQSHSLLHRLRQDSP
jgi:uroporphyrinogen-III synthase